MRTWLSFWTAMGCLFTGVALLVVISEGDHTRLQWLVALGLVAVPVFVASACGTFKRVLDSLEEQALRGRGLAVPPAKRPEE